jgi:hypothetical protein
MSDKPVEVKIGKYYTVYHGDRIRQLIDGTGCRFDAFRCTGVSEQNGSKLFTMESKEGKVYQLTEENIVREVFPFYKPKYEEGDEVLVNAISQPGFGYDSFKVICKITKVNIFLNDFTYDVTVIDGHKSGTELNVTEGKIRGLSTDPLIF